MNFTIGQHYNDPNLTNLLGLGQSAPAEGTAPALGSAPAGSVSMTPDALMAYCQTRMQDLDSQMQTYFDSEQQNYAQQQILDNVSQDVAAFSNGFEMDAGHSGMQLIQEIQQQIDLVGAKSALGQQLTQVRDSISNAMDTTGALTNALDTSSNPDATINGLISSYPSDTNVVQSFHGQINDPSNTAGLPDGDHRPVTADVMEGISKQIQDMTSDLSNQSQMGMIQLQSIMSDRQTALQMCTNLVQSLGDQSKSIADNIGK